MDRIARYRPYGIAVTDLSAQLWCEKQFEFSLERGRKKSDEMKKGNDRHRALHEEIATLIEVQPRSPEDYIALRLHNALVGLQRLGQMGITRELPVLGKINSLFIRGSIDEISLGGKSLKIMDTKTRKSDTMPSEAQKWTTRYQLMSYKHLFEGMQQGTFSVDDLLNYSNLKKTSHITEEFQTEIEEHGDEIEPNVSALASQVFSLIIELPPVSDELEIKYENQSTREIIGSEVFTFNHEQFKRSSDFVEAYWLGKRDAMLVGDSTKWKCHYCEFRDICDPSEDVTIAPNEK